MKLSESGGTIPKTGPPEATTETRGTESGTDGPEQAAKIQAMNPVARRLAEEIRDAGGPLSMAECSAIVGKFSKSGRPDKLAAHPARTRACNQRPRDPRSGRSPRSSRPRGDHESGRIEQVGSPDEVFHRPASEFVLRFLGNVNLFHGRTFVRPHEFEIESHRLDPEAVPTRIVRIQSAGPVVRIELTSEEGESLNVELAHDRYRELHLFAGSAVYVRVKTPAPIQHHSEAVR